jgi:methyltransferase (TIGR00027 family)
MAKEAAKTGVGPTVLVAIEQYFPEAARLLTDDLAYRIIPVGMKAFVWLTRFASIRDWMLRATEKDAPGIWAGMMVRKRYIDEKLIESIGQMKAVVNLGAGFDTRIYRLPELAEVPVWEVDQPENITAKQKGLQAALGEIPAHVRLVSIDFDHEALDTVLAAHGYSSDQPTFFIWEAVSQYLTEAGIRATFDFLSQVAPGSRLAFTYVRQDFLDGQVMYGWEKGYKQFVTSKLWLFGMEPGAWPAFLEPYGWRVSEDVGYEDLADQYVKPTGRALATMPIERLVYAEKT